MWTHVQRTLSRCLASLRQLRQIRRAVPSATLQMSLDGRTGTFPTGLYGNDVLVLNTELQCGPMPNLMVALPNIGGTLCSTRKVWLTLTT